MEIHKCRFVNCLRIIALSLLLASCTPLSPTPVTPQKTVTPSGEQESKNQGVVMTSTLEELREQYGPNPVFPFPDENTQQITFPGSSNHWQIIKPDVSANRYGIKISAARLDDKQLITDPNLQLFVMANSDLFQYFFGDLYKSTSYDDLHVMRQLEIVLINQPFLCGNPNDTNDLTIVNYIAEENTRALIKFRDQFAQNGFEKLPNITTPGYLYDYQLGGNRSFKENLYQLTKMFDNFKSSAKDGIKHCLSGYSLNEQILGTARFLVPEFVTDSQGQIVVGPDNIPLVYLKNRVYVAVDYAGTGTSLENPLFVSFSRILAHETQHALYNLTGNTPLGRIQRELDAGNWANAYTDKQQSLFLLINNQTHGLVFHKK